MAVLVVETQFLISAYFGPLKCHHYDVMAKVYFKDDETAISSLQFIRAGALPPGQFVMDEYTTTTVSFGGGGGI